jgi:hypothetical protein
MGKVFNKYSTRFEDKNKSNLISNFGDGIKKISMLRMYQNDNLDRKIGETYNNILEGVNFKTIKEEKLKEEFEYQKELMEFETMNCIKEYITSYKKFLEDSFKIMNQLEKQFGELDLQETQPKRIEEMKSFGRTIDSKEPVPKLLEQILNYVVENCKYYKFLNKR